MSGYDVEHGVDLYKTSKSSSTRRPDLTSFYSLANETFGDSAPINTHADPTPGNVTGLARMLADAFQIMLADHEDNELLRGMIGELDEMALHPPHKKAGVPESFFDELDRVDKKKLKKEESCPICSEPFLDDPYPLVVRLPCHPDHKFDLECIRPWLITNATCPLDRKELLKKKAPPPPADDDEEDQDSFYA